MICAFLFKTNVIKKLLLHLTESILRAVLDRLINKKLIYLDRIDIIEFYYFN